MKDEELAEQYAQNLEKELMKEYEEHLEYGQTPYLATIPTPHAKQAFLAGLEVRNNQLTKAKEIIKDLLRLPYANDWEVCGDVTSYLDKAEQFLKEIEKNDL